jgi:predicted MFS family arabinose efflux permease
MRRVTAITFLNHFVSGALTLLIPLLLLARNVNLADIGVVLSALPLVFLVARLLLAAVADQVGWSHIFLLVNWPATLISTAIYYVASSLPTFFAGRVVEGFRESSYWAVNRTAIFCLSPKREGQQATRINAVIWMATATGSAAAGAGIAFVGFSSTIIVLMLASAAIGVPAAMLWREWRKTSKPKSESFLTMFNLRGKGKTFWLVSLTIMFNSLATYPLVTLLLPVFMDQQLGYSYLTIGLLFMLYNLIASVTTLLTLRAPLNTKRAIIQSVIALAASAFLAVSGLFFPAVLCALAFVRGLGIAFFEHIVAKAAKCSKNISVDIGLLHVPMRLAEFSSVLAAGFVAQTVGFAPVFAATGVFFAVFSFMSLRILATNNP